MKNLLFHSFFWPNSRSGASVDGRVFFVRHVWDKKVSANEMKHIDSVDTVVFIYMLVVKQEIKVNRNLAAFCL